MILIAATCYVCKRYTPSKDLEDRDINGKCICKKCFNKQKTKKDDK